MGFEIKGFDKIQAKLKKLEENAKKLDGKHKVTFSDLYTPEFMDSYTNVKTINELIEKSGFEVSSIEDLNYLCENDVFNKFISQNTKFKTFIEMHKTAGAEYAKQRLYDGL